MFRRIPIAQEGVVVSNPVGKGKGLTNAKFATTTEVYPDSKSKPVTGVRVPPPPPSNRHFWCTHATGRFYPDRLRTAAMLTGKRDCGMV